MADLDLLVRGATVVTRDGAAVMDIGISDGTIGAVEPEISATSVEEIDGSGLHALPGGIDPHVHLDEPGRTHWEGFASGTRALAAGGMTTFIDMPLNNIPPTIDAPSFDEKRAAAGASSLVDFALWGGLVPGNVDRLEELAERGVAGFKAFMCHSGIDDFPAADDLTLYEGMARCAELGSIVLLHAENAGIVSGLSQRASDERRTTARDFIRSRPPIAEIEAISRAILFAEDTGCAIHIVHVSTARGVRMVAEASARGVDVSCETCPHYLLFTEEDLERIGVPLKSAPPVRDQSNREQLWELIDAGTLSMVTSDHSPGAPETKVGENFFAVWGGISGCQHTLQLLLAEGYEVRGLPLPRIVELVAATAADRFRLPGKGAIAVGYDADLALIDLSAETVVDTEDLQYRHHYSGYTGRPARGRVTHTIVRGQTVWHDGSVASEPLGRLIKVSRAPAATAGSVTC